MPKLYVIATPIGNLKDITLRAIEILKSVDIVLAEDTRVTRKLLTHFEISKPIMRFDEHVEHRMFNKAVELLRAGKNLALVTDAGTPGISDPGYRLISHLEAQLPSLEERKFSIVPVPGPSSLSAIISVSDINLSEFLFLGFPPHKKGRQTLFKRVAASEIPVILFESPHRILKTLKEILAISGDKYLNIGRELTKIYEEIFRGTISEAILKYEKEGTRGEFVLVLKP